LSRGLLGDAGGYAEIVASSRPSRPPRTRANIDEFTRRHRRHRGVAVPAGQGDHHLEPGEPPMLMRDTVYCLVEEGDLAITTRSTRWSPRCRLREGYRLKQSVQFEHTPTRTLIAPTSAGTRG